MTGQSVHASALKTGDHGILIRGVAGSGKSSLVLQVLSANPERSVLVADDRVILKADCGRLMASAPELLAGLIEIRGQGILRLPYISPAAIDLVVDIRAADECPRMPTEEERRVNLAGLLVPRIFVARGSGDGAARIGAALRWPLFQNT
jgi:serine kinase of HPr protein (carbohydrate metabolism regulator)